MKKIITTLGAVAVSATAAHAGGLDRSGQSTSILFETGNYVEFSYGYVKPKVSGIGAGTAVTAVTPTPGQASGDMSVNYSQISGALKYKINDAWDAAIIVDQPFGADISYPAATTYFARGSVAELNTTSITGLLKYKFHSNVSVHGGLRYQTLEAAATVPFLAAVAPNLVYTATGEKDAGLGYVVGVAYEKPEIALRISLTYNSKIKHSLKTFEYGSITSSQTEVETPQSVSLEAQSGVAKDTLIFGSIRWVDWSDFKLSPANYVANYGSPLVSYNGDYITYTLGVGRRLNEQWAIAASVGYEKPVKGLFGNLGPTDGKKSITLAATYTRDKMKITGGVTYAKLGDVQTTVGGGVAAANFTGNKAIGVGIKVGYSF